MSVATDETVRITRKPKPASRIRALQFHGHYEMVRAWKLAHGTRRELVGVIL